MLKIHQKYSRIKNSSIPREHLGGYWKSCPQAHVNEMVFLIRFESLMNFVGYSEAISQHLLKKFLLVVYFLDYAKCSHLIKHDPCLFCRDSEYKVNTVIYHGRLDMGCPFS
jgi:hypothetical protein